MPLEVVVIDGYVWLGGTRLGVDARLLSALGACMDAHRNEIAIGQPVFRT